MEINEYTKQELEQRAADRVSGQRIVALEQAVKVCGGSTDDDLVLHAARNFLAFLTDG